MAKEPTKDELRAELDRVHGHLSQLTEDWNALADELERTRELLVRVANTAAVATYAIAHPELADAVNAHQRMMGADPGPLFPTPPSTEPTRPLPGQT